MHLIKTKCPSLTSVIVVTSICFSFEPSLVLADPHLKPMKTSTLISESVKRTNSKDQNKLVRFRQAIAQSNQIETASLLNHLTTSENPYIMLEMAKLRLDQSSPFFDQTIGIRLVTQIYQSANDRLKAQAALLLGLHFKNSQNGDFRKQAIHWLERAALLNSPKAHIHLGDLYASDITAPPNYIKALHHYEMAAKKVSVAPLMSFARKVVSHMAEGKDCNIDPFEVTAKYLPLLFKEAASGVISAKKELGRLYLQGQLVQKDEVKGLQWLKKAATKGDAGALRDIARLEFAKADTASMREKAIEMLQISGSKGNGAAYATLAKIYLTSHHLGSDDMALQMYEKAVDLGFYGGLNDLKRIYDAERLLGKHTGRIETLSGMITTLSSKIAGYSLPSREEDNASNINVQSIDTLVVGSIGNQNQTVDLARQNLQACIFQ